MFDSIFVASDIIKHRVGRQSVISNRGSILSAVGVLHPIGASILSAVRVLQPIAEAFCRPSEYFIRLRKHPIGRESTPFNGSKHSVGRWSISAVVAGTLSGVGVLHPAASGTLSAVRVLFLFAEVFCRPLECFLCVVEPRDRKRVHCIHSFFGFNQNERSSCVSKICALSFRQCKVTNISWDIRQNGPYEHTN